MASTKKIEDHINEIQARLGNSSDFIVRHIRIGERESDLAAIAYIDGLVGDLSVTQTVIEPLLNIPKHRELEPNAMIHDELLDVIKQSVLKNSEIAELDNIEAQLFHIISGDTLIFLNGEDRVLAASTKGWARRGVEEPSSQTLVRGPREGFTEDIRKNVALLRLRIKSPDLRLETRRLGRVTRTNVSIMYIQGIANDKIVDEVRKRLDKIETDSILESQNIEELIEDATFTVIPTVYNTERPDATAAGLLEGRVAILVDGTPFVLIAPTQFVQFIHSSEDYYQRSDFGLIRMLRYLGLFIALLGPSLYIALTTFHHEMIPTALLISLVAQREAVPFPAFVEALLMEVTFEILREAGIRMPRAVGQAVSIVGSLVIGQAAVEAGIVSAAMVIVVAITAIATFTIPSYNMGIAVRLLRFCFMGLAASFGLTGIMIGMIALVLHLCSLRSFGVPFMGPLAPYVASSQKDAILRLPKWAMVTRPRLISSKNVVRERTPKPKPPTGGTQGGKGDEGS